MRQQKLLTGRFIRIKEARLREKAGRRFDPRRVFYEAMLVSETYEAYYSAIRGVIVSVETYKTGPITGDMEIKYAKRRGWIRTRQKQ